MSFGEWCATVGLVIGGGIAAVGCALFIFIMALRWPIVVIIAAWLIAKGLGA